MQSPQPAEKGGSIKVTLAKLEVSLPLLFDRKLFIGHDPRSSRRYRRLQTRMPKPKTRERTDRKPTNPKEYGSP